MVHCLRTISRQQRHQRFGQWQGQSPAEAAAGGRRPTHKLQLASTAAMKPPLEMKLASAVGRRSPRPQESRLTAAQLGSHHHRPAVAQPNRTVGASSSSGRPCPLT